MDLGGIYSSLPNWLYRSALLRSTPRSTLGPSPLTPRADLGSGVVNRVLSHHSVFESQAARDKPFARLESFTMNSARLASPVNLANDSEQVDAETKADGIESTETEEGSEPMSAAEQSAAAEAEASAANPTPSSTVITYYSGGSGAAGGGS